MKTQASTLSKAQKLLALAADPSVSEEEARSAACQAAKLIREQGFTLQPQKEHSSYPTIIISHELEVQSQRARVEFLEDVLIKVRVALRQQTNDLEEARKQHKLDRIYIGVLAACLAFQSIYGLVFG